MMSIAIFLNERTNPKPNKQTNKPIVHITHHLPHLHSESLNHPHTTDLTQVTSWLVLGESFDLAIRTADIRQKNNQRIKAKFFIVFYLQVIQWLEPVDVL
jgi:hypothetical protein